MKQVEIFYHLHTYGNHPVPCAAAIKTIEIIEREKLVENSEVLGNYFLEGLRTLEHHHIVGETRGVGLWTSIDFTADKETRAPLPASNLANMVAQTKSKGLIIKLAPVRMAFEFAPPLTIQKEDIDDAIKIIDECITIEERNMGL